MKIKRTLLSMVVFLFVFWFSLIIDIKMPSTSEKDYYSTTEEVFSLAVNDAKVPITSNSSDSYKDMRSASIPSSQSLTQSQSLDPTEEKVISGFSAIAAPEVTPTPELAADEAMEDKGAITEVIEEAEEEITEEVTEVTSLYSNIGISDAKSYVNIRETADTNGNVLGKLYRDSAAEILDTVGDWFHVESGSVTGYIKADYLKTGLSDDELIEKYGSHRIRIKVDGLNVREEATTESDKLTVVYMNETYPVIELQDEWLKVDITDDRVIGYVKREHVELIVNFKKAVSREEEQELERLKAEEKAKQETSVKYRDEVDYTKEELKLLACLVHSEAGTQSYEGKLAVANVVLNRVKSGKYPNSIKAVIYQSGQFTVAHSGSLAKQLDRYEDYSSNSQILSIKAARAALEGANNIGSRLYFNSYKSAVKKGYDDKNNAVKLEDHLFW